ncbi:endonuclease VII domain-containing protein [Yinghuangia sp. YIM S10712]|uniref:endonuclease VII domain-containing protein n=1 Tax=Yinghuangia sp. YIM S10712 TaxID=3436930 RepID=UPI003F52B1B7
MSSGHERSVRCPENKLHFPDPGTHAFDGATAYRRVRDVVRDRARQVKRTYGGARGRCTRTVEEQVGRCAICLVARAEHVDRDHETGKVRAVLCINCNAVLGHFTDSPDALRRAAAYLEGIVWKPTRVAPGVYRLPS